jgi:hypothetical protein
MSYNNYIQNVGVVLMKKVQNLYLLEMVMSLLLMAVIVYPAVAADLGFGAPSIKIVSPNDKATIPAGNVTVNVKVDDFNLANKLGAANVDGQGHIHYFMDVPVPTTLDKPAITAAGTYYPTANTSYTWTNVMPGMHNFTVELVNNDHTPLNPPKYTTINVTATS